MKAATVSPTSLVEELSHTAAHTALRGAAGLPALLLMPTPRTKPYSLYAGAEIAHPEIGNPSAAVQAEYNARSKRGSKARKKKERARKKAKEPLTEDQGADYLLSRGRVRREKQATLLVEDRSTIRHPSASTTSEFAASVQRATIHALSEQLRPRRARRGNSVVRL